jgi:SAM-dependent methyltransferase
MKSLKELFIHEVVAVAVAQTGEGNAVRVMDLGCGTAGYAPALLEAFPTVTYIGVEPIAASFAAAKQNLTGIDRATVHFQLGYDAVPDVLEGSCNVVFSLSVLEHIKQLNRFIALSAKYAAPGASVVHRYDLGHALHSHSIKERLHVLVGNHFPQLLPERQFVRYVPEPEVRACYEKNGLTPIRTTYHQAPNHKLLEKLLKGQETTAITDLYEWEKKHQSALLTIPVADRERLFPAVAVWGRKQ